MAAKNTKNAEQGFILCSCDLPLLTRDTLADPDRGLT